MFQEYKTIVPITAFQWTGEDVDGFTRSGNTERTGEMPVKGKKGPELQQFPLPSDVYLNVHTPAGLHIARPGDYIVKDNHGAFHVIRAAEFEAEYVAVAPAPETVA